MEDSRTTILVPDHGEHDMVLRISGELNIGCDYGRRRRRAKSVVSHESQFPGISEGSESYEHAMKLQVIAWSLARADRRRVALSQIQHHLDHVMSNDTSSAKIRFVHQQCILLPYTASIFAPDFKN